MKRERFAIAVLAVCGFCPALGQTPEATGGDKEARDVLRRALGQEATPKPAAKLPSAPPAAKQATLAEMEKQYLDGKITAREFQRFLQTHRAEPRVAKPASNETNSVHARALTVLHNATPNVAANRQGPAITEPLPEPPRPSGAPEAPEAVKAVALQDAEAKINELIRLKQAREQVTNTTAAPATTAAAEPRTKRQRLDDVLKLYIEGKLTDAEYKDRRAKILTEPD